MRKNLIKKLPILKDVDFEVQHTEIFAPLGSISAVAMNDILNVAKSPQMDTLKIFRS